MSVTQDFTPPTDWNEAIRQAAGLWGVQEEYWDIFGEHHVAAPEVLANVLKSMGVPADDPDALTAAIRARIQSEWSAILAPTIVASVEEGWLPIQLIADALPAELHVTFHWEDGESVAETVSTDALERFEEFAAEGRRYVRFHLRFPEDAPLGYHQISIDSALGNSTGRLIICPDRAYKPAFLDEGGKGAGIAVSLYGVRSSRNWGCGDITDLYALADWSVDALGVCFIGLNPLHSIPNRQPYNTSPYLPNCSFYRNPLYLDVERVVDVQNCALAQKLLNSARVQETLAEYRASEYVEYEKIWSLKLRFLKLGFRQFLREWRAGSDRVAAFRQYVEAEGELLDRFAVYLALDELIHKQNRDIWIWPDWPEEYRDPSSQAVTECARRHWRLVLFYKYIQWQLDLQLAAAQRYAKQRGLTIGLYHDLALATDRCGSDLWAHRRYYIAGCRVGSPPDAFSPKGQDWAFPPPNSAAHHEDGYRLFIESIRKNCTHGGALRIDHVMRFFRLFWIPDRNEAKDGVYVSDFSDDLLRILALESVRNQVIVIGEDLGTVEPYIRQALKKYGILSYRLLYFEKNSDESFRTPDQYPRQALVSVSTHDLPTLAGFWLGRDIEARRAAGVLRDEENYRSQWRTRNDEKQKMLDVMFSLNLLPSWFPRRATDVPEFTGELHNASVGFLASTPSELMVLSIEDLFKQTDQQNLPGTTDQYPNWRGKVRYSVEELGTDEHARACALMFRTWLEKTGRVSQRRTA